MLHPVKVFDGKGNLKKIISKEELEERFWNPKTLKANNHFFALKGSTPKYESGNKLNHGKFHPDIS